MRPEQVPIVGNSRNLVDLGPPGKPKVCGICGKRHNYATDCDGNPIKQTVTGTDGKQYPAARAKRPTFKTPEQEEKWYEKQEQAEKKGGKPKLTKKQVAELPPCRGLFQADRAISAMELIEENDTQRGEAFVKVKGWIKDHEKK
jgi:hypothetical protein